MVLVCWLDIASSAEERVGREKKRIRLCFAQLCPLDLVEGADGGIGELAHERALHLHAVQVKVMSECARSDFVPYVVLLFAQCIVFFFAFEWWRDLRDGKYAPCRSISMNPMAFSRFSALARMGEASFRWRICSMRLESLDSEPAVCFGRLVDR